MDDLNLDIFFSDDNYSIESLIGKAKECKLTLKELRDRLIDHQEQLNQTSLELSNNSYDKFYKLSDLISRLADPLQELIHPLKTFHGQLSDLCSDHVSYVGQIDSYLNALEDTSRNKLLARRMIDLMKRRDRLEKLFELIDWSLKPVERMYGPESPESRQESDHSKIQTQCDLLERVSIELHLLISEVRALKPSDDELITIKNSLENCLDERQSQQDSWFEKNFLKAVENQDRNFIDLVLRTYSARSALISLKQTWRSAFFNDRLYQIAASIEIGFSQQPMTESDQELGSPKLKLRITKHIYLSVTKCWSDDIYIEAFEFDFTKLCCRIINRFADWLSKLRLSDFRISGPSISGSTRQTNFLAQQDAVMHLLILDCNDLARCIEEFVSSLKTEDRRTEMVRLKMVKESLDTLRNGLNNVLSLRKLIEK